MTSQENETTGSHGNGARQTCTAVLGLGAMGGGMALRLADQGLLTAVWNRSPERAQPLREAGAVVAATPAQAVVDADAVLLSLADQNAVEAVLFGPEGAAGALAPGSLIIDTSTLSPEYSRELTARLEKLSLRRIEANVLGNPAQARAGELRVLTAGEPEPLADAGPVLKAIGAVVIPLGATGAAATAKLVFNSLLGAQLASLAEAARYAQAAGLDPRMIIGAVAGSGFASKVMAFRCRLALEDAFRPASFRSRLMHKDLAHAVEDAGRLDVALPVAAASAELFAQTLDGPLADLDAAAVLLPEQAGAGA